MQHIWHLLSDVTLIYDNLARHQNNSKRLNNDYNNLTIHFTGLHHRTLTLHATRKVTPPQKLKWTEKLLSSWHCQIRRDTNLFPLWDVQYILKYNDNSGKQNVNLLIIRRTNICVNLFIYLSYSRTKTIEYWQHRE